MGVAAQQIAGVGVGELGRLPVEQLEGAVLAAALEVAMKLLEGGTVSPGPGQSGSREPLFTDLSDDGEWPVEPACPGDEAGLANTGRGDGTPFAGVRISQVGDPTVDSNARRSDGGSMAGYR